MPDSPPESTAIPDPPRSPRKWRVTLLVCAGILLVSATLAYRHFWLARPVGEGPAGPAVPREAFTKTWTDRKVLLLGVGDGVTAGFGASAGHSYFDRLAANPSDEFEDMDGISLAAVLPNLRTLNIARSGSTSIGHLDILNDQLEKQPADTFGLVVMTSGGNDLIHSYGQKPPREGAMYGATLAQARPWIAAYAKRLEAMVDRLEEVFPGGCMIFLGDIYDPTDGIGDAASAGLPDWPDGTAIHAAYQEAIHRCAARRKSVRVVGLYDAFLGHGIHCAQFWRAHYRSDDPHYWFAYNLEDPNERGYDAIRRLFLIEMARASANIAKAGR